MVSLFGRGPGRCLILQNGRLAGMAHASLASNKSLFCDVFPRAAGSCGGRPDASLSSHEKGRPSTAARADFGPATDLFRRLCTDSGSVRQGSGTPSGFDSRRCPGREGEGRLRRKEASDFHAGKPVNSAGWTRISLGKPGFHFAEKCSKTCAATVNRRGSRLSAGQLAATIFDNERSAAAGSRPAA